MPRFSLRTLVVIVALLAAIFAAVAYLMWVNSELRREWEERHRDEIEQHEREQKASAAIP